MLLAARPSTRRSTALFVLGLAVLCAAVLVVRWPTLHASWPFPAGPDEPNLIRRSHRVLTDGDLDLSFYSWGSLPIYALALIYRIGALVAPGSELAQPAENPPGASFYFLARAASMCLSVATVAIWAVMVRKLYGTRLALTAAVLYAVLPLHTELSRIAAIDPWMVLFFALTGLSSVRIAQSKGRAIDYALAGATIGLAAACKYTGALACLFVIFAHFAAVNRRPFALLLLAGLASLVALLVSMPYIVLDYGGFSAAVARQGRHYGASNVLHPRVLHTSHVEQFVILLRGVTLPLLLLAIPGALWLVRRGPRLAALSVGPSAALFLFVGSFRFYYDRNLLAVLPGASLLAAAGVVWLGQSLSARAPKIRRWVIDVAIIILTLAAPLLSSIQHVRSALLPDTRNAVRDWLRERVAADALIVREVTTPVLERSAEPPVTLVISAAFPNVEALVDSADVLVLNGSVFQPIIDNPEEFPEAHARYRQLFASRPLLATFASADGLQGQEFRVYGSAPRSASASGR